MPRTPTLELTPADQERRRALRVTKGIALGALIAMAVLFVIGFLTQDDIPAMAYVRAAGEGGMVGALADWFAVTALFRHPLYLPIPHTAIIPNQKDRIGETLGEFLESNFLATAVVREYLAQAQISAKLGGWLRERRNAERIGQEAGTIGVAVLNAVSDDDVQEVIASLAREHLIEPEWGTTAGVALDRVLQAGAHRPAVDLAADSISTWLHGHPEAFDGLFSKRLPSWVPSMVTRAIDGLLYSEAVKFVDAVRYDQAHQARIAIDGYLSKLAHNLQHDPVTRAKLENAKGELFDSPRVGAIASDLWSAAKAGLITSLRDADSGLRVRLADVLADVGTRLATEEALQRRIDGWIVDAASFLVERYRHDIASIVTTTIEKWDAEETSEKLELLVGKDLQYIRLNGTVVGALAGVAIYTIAHLLLG
ncbi:MAG: DUF445 domain-containing protein [Microbacterium sp.]